MGCFPCFDSREEETLNPDKGNDDPKHGLSNISSKISSLPSGAERLRSRSSVGSKRDLIGPKDGPGAQIAAQTFTFRELAAATKNFRSECFLGEGGFGCVYKGRLESTGQESSCGPLEWAQSPRRFQTHLNWASLQSPRRAVPFGGDATRPRPRPRPRPRDLAVHVRGYAFVVRYPSDITAPRWLGSIVNVAPRSGTESSSPAALDARIEC